MQQEQRRGPVGGEDLGGRWRGGGERRRRGRRWNIEIFAGRLRKLDLHIGDFCISGLVCSERKEFIV